jgi:hypothetical protein
MKATDRAAAIEYTSQAISQPQYLLVRLKLRSTKARLARSSRVAMVIGSSLSHRFLGPMDRPDPYRARAGRIVGSLASRLPKRTS